MRRRPSTMISREGWYYLLVFSLVFVGAMLRNVNLLLVLNGMLIGPLLLSRFLAVRSIRGLLVDRRVPKGVCAGDLLVANVTVTNPRSHLGCWGIVIEEPIHREGNGAARRSRRRDDLLTAAHVLFPYVPAGHAKKADYRGRINERGRYRLGPLRLSTRFPFGLFRYTVMYGYTVQVTVYPRLGRLTQGWIARHRESFAGTDRRERRPGSEGDFYGLRAWQRGDSRRWIHWRATARTGEVVVRQFEQPRNRDAAVVLDLWQPESPDEAQADNVELAVSLAATIVADLCRKGGSDVFLLLADPEPRLSGGPSSPALLQEMMERLAVAPAGSTDHLPALLARAGRQVEPGTEIIVVSTRPVDFSEGDCPSFRASLGHHDTVGGDTKMGLSPSRFGDVPSKLLRQARAIDTSSGELDKWFVME